MLYVSIVLVVLLNIVAILRLLYKKLGAVLFCDYFKKNNPGAYNIDDAYSKMRKLVRDGDLKGFDDDDNDDKSPFKKDKMKILQDLRKAKNFLINWKDDPKAKYYVNPLE